MIEFKNLPYAHDALVPHISAETLKIHHGRHHKTYVDKLNALLKGTVLEEETLSDIIRSSAGNADLVGIFNNAAQVWNHEFFWQSMSPSGGGQPTDEGLLSLINSSFGSYDSFCKEFIEKACAQFGSGWVWLVDDLGSLKIITTGNAYTPLTYDVKPLLTCDLWEHSYYLDYQNKRPDYMKVFVDNLLNWQFVLDNMEN